MKQSGLKIAFLTFWVVLLVVGMLATTLPRSVAVPLAAITGTPTEQATRTPTSVPTSTSTPAPSRPTTRPNPSEPADPAVTKSVNVSEARIGDEITFTITVTNKGPGTAEDVVVNDSIPDYLDVIQATTTRGNISSSGRTVRVDIGSVAPGDVVTIRIRVRVNERAQPPAGRNGVTITTSSSGDDPGNNSSQVTFGIVGEPTVTPTLVSLTPTVVATATPPKPRTLPRTGDSDGGVLPFVALAGLLAIGLSLLARRGARR